MTTEEAIVLVRFGLMTQAQWNTLTTEQRIQARNRRGLTEQLIGLEGCRVEVIDHGPMARARRFVVGLSSGWEPVHIELLRRTSSGGDIARASYKSVVVVAYPSGDTER